MGETRKRQRSEQEDPEASSSSNEFEVSMPNGSACKVRGLRVLDLKVQSQILFQKGFLKLVAKDKVLDVNGRCDEQLKPGDCVTAIAQKPKVVGTQDAFALFCVGGDTVVTWGNYKHGGSSSPVDERLRNVVDIQRTDCTFSAILDTGTVVTWGCLFWGGHELVDLRKLSGVPHITAACQAFAAITADRKVITWGDRYAGGDSSSVQHQLHGVLGIAATRSAFAAWLESGCVVAWGDSTSGGEKWYNPQEQASSEGAPPVGLSGRNPAR